jgi:hypothetical protein
MFWYPYTGSIPYVLNWPAGLFTTGLAVATAVGMVRVALLALRPAQYGHGGPRSEAVTVPFDPVMVDDQAPEVKQDAA